MIKRIFLIPVIILLILSACSPSNGQSMRAGTQAPDFAIRGLNGENIVLSQLNNARPVVLDFWASWCPYCVQEMPHLNQFYAENKYKLDVIGINVGESQARAQDVVRRKGVSYPVGLDQNRQVSRSYKVVGIPTVVYIDQGGEILYYGHSITEMRNKLGI